MLIYDNSHAFIHIQLSKCHTHTFLIQFFNYVHTVLTNKVEGAAGQSRVLGKRCWFRVRWEGVFTTALKCSDRGGLSVPAARCPFLSARPSMAGPASICEPSTMWMNAVHGEWMIQGIGRLPSRPWGNSNSDRPGSIRFRQASRVHHSRSQMFLSSPYD